MKATTITLAQIGNSRGIRLPAGLIQKYGFEQGMILEDRGHEIALVAPSGPRKLSWEATAREMASAAEDWSEWDATGADGLENIPWTEPAPKPKRPASKTKACRKK